MSKEYLDHCFYCHTSKAEVIVSRRYQQNIICGIEDSQTGELLSEIKGGRHTFVVTDKERKAYEEDMRQGYFMGLNEADTTVNDSELKDD